MAVPADIVVYSPDDRLLLIVEVKASPERSPQKAARLRRNLLVHQVLPNAPYFLLAFPTYLFLWKHASPTAEVQPDFVARTTEVLRDYLGGLGEGPRPLAEESLHIALSSWLRDLADTTRSPRVDSEADQMILRSGLYEVIRRGQVISEAA